MAQATMVKVEAVRAVRDNGVTHAVGEEFEMEKSVADAHVKAGVVKEVGKTPADKQAKAAATK